MPSLFSPNMDHLFVHIPGLDFMVHPAMQVFKDYLPGHSLSSFPLLSMHKHPSCSTVPLFSFSHRKYPSPFLGWWVWKGRVGLEAWTRACLRTSSSAVRQFCLGATMITHRCDEKWNIQQHVNFSLTWESCSCLIAHCWLACLDFPIFRIKPASPVSHGDRNTR